jgi:hypothetical protein
VNDPPVPTLVIRIPLEGRVSLRLEGGPADGRLRDWTLSLDRLGDLVWRLVEEWLEGEVRRGPA